MEMQAPDVVVTMGWDHDVDMGSWSKMEGGHEMERWAV